MQMNNRRVCLFPAQISLAAAETDNSAAIVVHIHLHLLLFLRLRLLLQRLAKPTVRKVGILAAAGASASAVVVQQLRFRRQAGELLVHLPVH